jgi:hypothetical protein
MSTPRTAKWLAAIAETDPTGASEEVLDQAAARLGIDLPKDYRDAMQYVDGGESDFGES